MHTGSSTQFIVSLVLLETVFTDLGQTLSYSVKDAVAEPRIARSYTSLSKHITKFLTKDAKEVHTKSPFYRKYIKYGTLDGALQDFRATKPSSIRQCSRGVDECYEGIVGDHVVRLRVHDDTHSGKPTILYFDPALGNQKKKQIKVIYVSPKTKEIE